MSGKHSDGHMEVTESVLQLMEEVLLPVYIARPFVCCDIILLCYTAEIANENIHYCIHGLIEMT